MTPEQIKDRFAGRLAFDGSCWLAQWAEKHHGYRQLRIDGIRYAAHRWVYEQVCGPIPDGLELDHLCRRTNCLNPEHLEPVTHAENMRRRVLSVCKRGHNLTAPGARYETQNRACVQCARLRASRKEAA